MATGASLKFMLLVTRASVLAIDVSLVGIKTEHKAGLFINTEPLTNTAELLKVSVTYLCLPEVTSLISPTLASLSI